MSAPAGNGLTAGAVVDLVAERLADPEEVARVASDDANRDPVHEGVPWSPLTLSHGLPGAAMLFAELTRTADVDRHVRAAARVLDGEASHGLYAGPAALLAAVGACGGHYPGLRRRLASWVAADQLTRIRQVAAQGRTGVPWPAYDVISGPSGTGRLLLDSAEDPDEGGADVDEGLDATLRHLVRLTEPVQVAGRSVPGWWVPPDLQAGEQDQNDYPRGHLNLGLAHGIAGPLALLALATQRGFEVPGQREAADRAARWLLGWARVDEEGATYWPARVGLADELDGGASSGHRLFTRPAWCYGTPGVAAALHRAGVAFDEPSWRGAAARGLRDALAAEGEHGRWAVHGPTVCHGDAGVLEILHRVGSIEEDEVLLAGRDRMARRILARADPAAPFVFRHVMRAGTVVREVDVAGVLEGAAGVACALRAVTSGAAAPSRPWSRVLLVS